MKNNFKTGFFFGILTMVIVVGIGFAGKLAFTFANDFLSERGIGGVSEYSSYEEKIDEIDQLLDQYYYEEFDKDEMADAALKGYLKGVGDPYTTYYNQEDVKEFFEDSDGEYEGIGVVVGYTEEGNLIEVVSPFIDSPGEKAGLLPGDIIMAVDGVDVTEKDLNDVVKLIKGEKDTQVVLTVFRNNKNERKTMDVEIIRASIDVPTVKYEMMADDIGYVQITGFKEHTYDQFMKAYRDLESQGEKGMIIDLRNNPGGYLEIVNLIADQLLPEGLIVYTEDKYGNKKEYKTDEEHQLKKPIVVLINENSASASEILSGAIKDHERGTLVGKTTFGKGLVQTTKFLDDGTMIKLTIERYFTPDGYYIHKKGVEPDVEVELPESVLSPFSVKREEDTQLDKAIEIMLEKIK